MRILYDHQALGMQRRGGVSRYVIELVRNMASETGAKVKLALLRSNNEYVLKNKSSNTLKSTSVFGKRSQLKEFLRGNIYLMKAHIFFKDYMNKIYSIFYLRTADFDIFHPTYYDPYFLPHIGKKPFVITIHDMIHEIFPEYFSKKDTTSTRKHLLAHQAKGIIAISQNTKDDVVRLLGVHPDKITVVHHANFLVPKEEEPLSVPARYILYVGGRGRYKNFSFFVESIAHILREEKDIHVLCIGGGEFAAQEVDLFNALSIREKILHTGANDKQLAYAYRHAECFVLSSLYEGFGIPILEAFAFGCPVLLSNASCFPEIAADAGCYFDPKDKDSIFAATQTILNDPSLRKDLIQKGYKRLENFSSAKMIQETYAVYKKCLAN